MSMPTVKNRVLVAFRKARPDLSETDIVRDPVFQAMVKVVQNEREALLAPPSFNEYMGSFGNRYEFLHNFLENRRILARLGYLRRKPSDEMAKIVQRIRQKRRADYNAAQKYERGAR
jgi:hypothetical protein